MLKYLEERDKLNHKNGGKPNKIKGFEHLEMTFKYWREYRTYFHIAAEEKDLGK